MPHAPRQPVCGQVAQPCAGAAEAGAHGAHGDAHVGRHRLVGAPLQAAEPHQVPFALAEAGEGAGGFPQLHPPGLGGLDGVLHRHHRLCMPLGLLAAVEEQVAQDGGEPCLQVRAALEQLEPRQGAHHAVLHQVVRVAGVAGKPEGIAPQLRHQGRHLHDDGVAHGRSSGLPWGRRWPSAGPWRRRGPCPRRAVHHPCQPKAAAPVTKKSAQRYRFLSQARQRRPMSGREAAAGPARLRRSGPGRP